MTLTKKVALSAAALAIAIISSPFVEMAIDIHTAPEILTFRSNKDMLGEFGRRSPSMQQPCDSGRRNANSTGSYYASEALYDYVTDRHPIGSPASDLIACLESNDFDIHRCKDAGRASLRHTTAPFVETVVKISWREDQEGKITELGVTRGGIGL
tara:strand:- start:2060 stop:2524 length:465 start_codon:yes stop_codon:yes gene_type:complete